MGAGHFIILFARIEREKKKRGEAERKLGIKEEDIYDIRNERN